VPRSRAPFGGGIFIADTSAWARAKNPPVRAQWTAAIEAGVIATTAPVRFELLLSATDGAEFEALDEALAKLRDIPISRSVTNAAMHALRRLAHARPPVHRGVRVPDLLIAAAAQDAGIGVLHYDEHFDRLATVLAFESRWTAPRGSLD
jgi:predicted nucleic acid-binding protein